LDVSDENVQPLLADSTGTLSGWNFESFDLPFDFVGESRRTGAIYNPVIKRQREGDYLCAFVFLFVSN
jgi:hypothetical protein